MTKENTKEDIRAKRNYEISFWLSSELNDDKLEESFNKIKGVITKLGGIIGLSQLPQLKQLAYPIKKEMNGYFGYFQFMISPNHLKDIKSVLDKENIILRYLIIALPASTKEIRTKSHFRPKENVSQKIKEPENITPPKQKESSEVDMKALDKKLNEILK